MKPTLLRDERKRRGWSQAQLAEFLGTSTKTVVRWELGQCVPLSYYHEKLFALFGKTPQELGLLQNTDEDDIFNQTVLPVVSSSFSDIPGHPPFLTDPTIPLHLKSCNTLHRCDGSLMLVKESLFAADTVHLKALHGLPSTGETALAVALATDRHIQAHFCDGILWARLGFHPNVLSTLTRWGKLLGIASSQVENLQSREAWGRVLRAALGTRQMLLIIDHVCRIEDALALQVGGRGCAHLLTTYQPEVALGLAHQGAIVISELEGANRIAFLHRILSQPVEGGDSGCTNRR